MTTLAQPKDSLEVCYSNILVVSRTLGMLVIIEEDQLCCSNLSTEESSVLLYCDTFCYLHLEHLCQLPSANQRPPLCKTVLIGIIDAGGEKNPKNNVLQFLNQLSQYHLAGTALMQITVKGNSGNQEHIHITFFISPEFKPL